MARALPLLLGLSLAAAAWAAAPVAERLAAADALLVAGRHAAAADAYAALAPAVAKHPRLAREVRLSLGRAQLGALRAAAARDTFRQVLADGPDERQTRIALNGLAAAHALDGRPAEARRILRDVAGGEASMATLRRMGRVREAARPAMPPAPPAAPAAAEGPEGRPWHWLQHGLFASPGNAERLRGLLEARVGARVWVTPRETRPGKMLHFVHSGPYTSLSARRAAQRRLAGAGREVSDFIPSRCGPAFDGC